jgi:hypothetical protein
MPYTDGFLGFGRMKMRAFWLNFSSPRGKNCREHRAA